MSNSVRVVTKDTETAPTLSGGFTVTQIFLNFHRKSLTVPEVMV